MDIGNGDNKPEKVTERYDDDAIADLFEYIRRSYVYVKKFKKETIVTSTTDYRRWRKQKYKIYIEF